MPSAVEDHVIRRIAEAPVRPEPYPHVYVEHVFPDDFYSALRAHWPQSSQLVSLTSTGRVSQGYSEDRFVMPLRQEAIDALSEEIRAFWAGVSAWMLGSNRLLFAVIDKFEPYVRRRFGDALESIGLTHEVLVVRDRTNYNLGPHTDSPRRVVSVLFYCPDDASFSHLGTSLYEPLDPAFRCPGGPHHPHERFRRVATMEYRPNTLFAFVKTDQSFHGVEPIRDDVSRDLILYDIQTDAVVAQHASGEVEAAASASRKGRSAAGGSLGVRLLKNILRRGR